MTLHPDFPTHQIEAQYWDQPDPIGDIVSALRLVSGDVSIANLASVELYDITSTDGKWAPGGSVGSELQMTLLGQLTDGRWFALEAGNDYTGWGCIGDSAEFYAHEDRDDVIANGLTAEGRNALGVEVSA